MLYFDPNLTIRLDRSWKRDPDHRMLGEERSKEEKKDYLHDDQTLERRPTADTVTRLRENQR